MTTVSRHSAFAAIAPLLLGAVMFAGTGCATRAPSQTATPIIETTPARAPATPLASRTVAAAPNPPLGAQPQLASDPAQLADDLVADERTLRDPSTPDPALVAAAHREQAAYRAIARHPEWDSIARPRVPPELVDLYDRNLDARRQLQAMTPAKDTLPAWRVQPPVPADELISDYHAAEAETGVGWNYLAAINLIETRFGSINGVSTAGAQGPMQFLPSTFATYGQGGDINSAHDSIMAAARFLAANGFANDPDHAIYGYNHAHEYVRAVDQYAALIASDPATFPTYYRWDVYYVTTAGDVLLPVGYAEPSPVPVGDYLATHPQ
ncbi:lytic transglycosylase [Mycobacterium malmoense]|uniref:Lytic transglycosylase n=2 Tax=Mycobacterium malmoense TaxID=1780 RepID=A0A1B9D950_MYCMA|nr:lytic transglycosylase [Mycobacterium malmoense]OCB55268.1 lytic transglycosylase [Mycobacterium malmoense]